MVQTKCIVKFILPKRSFPLGITGNTIQTFDTDCGKIGIVICYDVEFPELSRLMADEGMNILFVPFLTDIKMVTHE
jgi:predicted amidohydrolase